MSSLQSPREKSRAHGENHVEEGARGLNGNLHSFPLIESIENSFLVIVLLFPNFKITFYLNISFFMPNCKVNMENYSGKRKL